MSMRVRSRRTLITSAAVAAALSLTAVTPALAGTGAAHSATAHTASASAVQGDPRDAIQRVADFYGAYIDAAWDGQDPASGTQANALKAFYLSTAARKKVAAYEASEHADGILFAQNIPVKWQVAYTGSGAGRATTLVTLTWSDSKNAEVTKIAVQSDLRTHKITDLKPVG
ncbi:hypothetical protein ACIHCX_16535 [Streptomyces sp. NPDC052043]|uniref:hypothetical protein n=1 Tax=Streptomyces sp. NPDC052043 TaxID=3365684 RepID=UPI0037D21149